MSKKLCLLALSALLLSSCANSPFIPPNKYKMGSVVRQCHTDKLFKIVGIAYYDFPLLQNVNGEFYKGWMYHLMKASSQEFQILTEQEICYFQLNSKYGTRSNF